MSEGNLSEVQEERRSLRIGRWQTFAAWLLLCGALFVCVHRSLDAVREGGSRDFANIFAGSTCVVEQCRPYDVSVLQQVLLEKGYRVKEELWAQNLPIYPPTTLALFTPFAPLNFPQARAIFYLLTIAVLALSCVWSFTCCAALASLPPVVRMLLFASVLLVPKTIWALTYGNPVVLTIALLALVAFDGESTRWRLHGVLLALAVLLKPQIGLPMAIVLLLTKPKRVAMAKLIVAGLGLYIAVVLVWFSMHPSTADWLQALRQNLAVGAKSTMSSSDRTAMFDTLLNLRYLIGYWVDSPQMQAALTLVILAALVGSAIVSVLRLRRRGMLEEGTPVLLIVAVGAALTLLPVYHRFYDGLLILLVLPSAVLALWHRRDMLSSALTIALVFASSFMLVRHIPVRLRGEDLAVTPTTLFNFFTHRWESIMVLALSINLVAALHRYARQRRPHEQENGMTGDAEGHRIVA